MRRSNIRNSYVFGLLIALFLPILAACGSGQPTNAPTSAPATQASAAPAAPTLAPASLPTAVPASQPTAAPAAGATNMPAATAVPSTGAAGGILRVAQTSWPHTLDPQDMGTSNEIAVGILNYEGLTRFDKDLKTVPAAAESWEYNQDASAITFHLRDGLKYSDGSPLTAQDFVNAIYRTLDPRGIVGDYQSSLSMIKGADVIIATQVPTEENQLTDRFKALGVSAPDERTLSVELTQPTPYFHTLAALWVVYPAKQELVEKGGETWWEDAANHVGNGPFQITKLDRSSNLIEFKANENYWRGRPKLDGVQFTYIEDLSVAFQAYKNGEVDTILPDPNDVPTIKADPVLSKEYVEYAGACTEAYEINHTIPPFDNLKFRQALAYGFDREAYIRDALKDTSIKTLTWIPPGYPGYDASENRFDYDPAKAKQLLAEAGYPDGQGLPEIKWAYGSSNPANQARMEYIVQMYQNSLGITIVPDPIETATLNGLRNDVTTHPMINSGGWCADYPDQQNWLSIYWHSSAEPAKNVGYKNAEADKLMEQADVEVDPEKRTQLYDQAQKLIVGDVAYLIRSNTKNYWLIKSHVKGMNFTPQDSDYPGMITSLYDVTLEK